MATLIEKLFSRHTGKRVRAGDMADLTIDVRAARDFGGAHVVRHLQNYHLPIDEPSKTIFTFDCNPTGSDQLYAENQQICRQFAQRHKVRIYDIDQGIGTHLAIDKGLVGPGDTFVSTDSHANLLGAIGAFGQGMGDVDIAYTFSHGKIWFQVPPTLKIRINGILPKHCTAKDLILSLLRQHIHPEVFDPEFATEFFRSFGPFDPARIKLMLIDLLAAHPDNLHMSFYLNHIHNQLFGGA